MSQRLTDMIIEEMSLVDRPAEPNAKVALFKRDDAGHEDDGNELLKRMFSSAKRKDLASAGKALPDGSFPIASERDLRNAIQAFGRASDQAAARAHIVRRARALGATSLLPESWNVAKEDEVETPTETPGLLKRLLKRFGIEDVDDADVALMEEELLVEVGELTKTESDSSQDDGSDSSTEENMDLEKSALPPEVQEAIDKADEEKAEALAKVAELQAQVDELTKTDGEGDESEDLLKSADPAIRELVAKAQQEAEEATAIAKAEREKRLNREFFEKADSLPHISGDTDDLAELLKSVSALVPEETFGKIEEILRAANEQIETGELFKTAGVEGEVEGDDAYGKLVKIAKRYQEGDADLSYEAAFVKAVENNPDLYDDYAREV